MKTSRSLLIWTTLVLCGFMVLGALSWLTRGVLASEKERAMAEARADLEERTRLALWRMDAVGAALLLSENQRSPLEFQIHQQDLLATNKTNPWVNLHFEVRSGRLTSPEAEGSTTRLQSLRKRLSKNGDIDSIFNSAAENGEKTWQALQKDAPALQSKIAETNQSAYASKRASPSYQEDSNRFEKVQRAKIMEGQEASTAVINQNNVIASNAFAGIDAITGIGSMRGVWIDQELFLLRCVMIRSQKGESPVIQGAWINADKVRQHLLDAVADLLPGANLEAITDPVYSLRPETTGTLDAMKSKTDDALALVSFPFRLHRNTRIELPPLPWNKALLVGWIAVLLALLIASFLVHGVMRLSERRASFVSAVTHELRTPLTTFRLYSDMLESGAVKEEKRGAYLRVLSREADRLSHLVENVLAFSKIERGSARATVCELSLADLLAPMRERLAARLATANLTLMMDTEAPAASTVVRVDSAAVEHILFNLIDNAAKYASAGNPPRVEICAKTRDHHAEIVVSDNGPGIPVTERSRIFRAFHKSAREAAESKPGVGLGLALSRRLAKSLGGGLECMDSPHGACFILRIPRT